MQKDLFGTATINPLSAHLEKKPDFLERYRLNLRLDQALIAVLVLLVAYVLVFSFGVESGKRYAMAEIKAERAMRERMARELGEKIFANSQNVSVMSPSLKTPEASSLKSEVKSLKPESGIDSNAELPAKADSAPASSEKMASSNGRGKFAVQTVTFTSKAVAEAQVKKLLAKGYQSFILPQGKFQQICVGGFETRQSAFKALVALRTQGLAPKDAFIRNVN